MKGYNYEKEAKAYRKRVEHGQNSTYKTARLIAKIISGMGWVVIGWSFLFLFLSIGENNNSTFAGLSILFVVAGIVIGLIAVILGQLTRATVDNADTNAEMLAIMKSAHVKDKPGDDK